MNVDRLYMKGPDDADFVAMDTEYDLYLKWRRISAPRFKSTYDEIPGTNGSLDSTEEFGEVFYDDRELWIGCVHLPDEWQANIEALTNAYHAQSVKIAFSNDPDYYWVGRLTVGEYSEEDHNLEMTARVFPFKFKKTITTVTSAGNETVTLTNGRMKVVPDVTISGPVTLAWGTNTKTLSASSYPTTVKIAGLELTQGSLDVTITGSANVTFSYREGSL